MQRRRLMVLAVAVGAGAALLVFGRPDSDAVEQVAPPVGQAPAPQARSGPAIWPPAGQPPTGQPPAGQPAATPPGQGSPSPTDLPTATVPPTAPHDAGGVTGDESLDAASARRAVAAAEQFAELWASPAPDWHDRLAEFATPGLAAALAGADPPEPARQITGPGRVLYDAPAWARIAVPADRGTIVLDLVVAEGRWLVSALDWWPA